MSKKSNKQARRGTLALCVTAGLIIGVGLGPFIGDMWLSTLIFGLFGLAAGMIFTHRNRS